MVDIILTGQQIEQFRNALVTAFHTPKRLEQMLHFALNEKLTNLVANASLNDMVYDLILYAEANGWLYRLLLGAREQNKNNKHLKEFEQSLSLSTRNISKSGLEAKIRVFDRFISLNEWLPKLHQIEKQVCKIELPQKGSGTGFLVSSNIVLTNYHVLKKLIEEQYSSNEVKVRFDYKKIRPQSEGLDGEIFALADDWLIGYSPLSVYDAPFKNGAPSKTELDYALIRLADHLDRGAIQLPNTSTESFYQNYEAKKPLFIVQHPNGEPMKLAVDVDSILGLNENETRLYHKTLTEGGSSGSPCFNQNLDLIALHHIGFEGSRNGGIPIHTLIEDWRQRGFLSSENEWLK